MESLIIYDGQKPAPRLALPKAGPNAAWQAAFGKVLNFTLNKQGIARSRRSGSKTRARFIMQSLVKSSQAGIRLKAKRA